VNHLVLNIEQQNFLTMATKKKAAKKAAKKPAKKAAKKAAKKK
jgi:hypothetical protein